MRLHALLSLTLLATACSSAPPAEDTKPTETPTKNVEGTSEKTPVSIKVPSGDEETFDAEVVKRRLQAKQTSIQKCYSSQLRDDPKASGKLAVVFTILPDGSVGDVDVTENTVGEATATCATSILSRLEFPPTGKASPLAIRKAYVFSSE